MLPRHMHACECFPLNTALRTVRQTSQAFSRMRVHIYNLSDGVNGQLFPLNPFNSERVCFSFLFLWLGVLPQFTGRTLKL